MAKLSTLVLLAAAIVSAVPVAQDDGNTLPVSTPLNDSHSFTKTDGGEDAPVQDYCGTIPEKPTTAEHQTATATFSYSATHETLAPKVHWSVDTKPATNVIPTPPEKGSQLYYGVNDPSESGNYAFLTYNFNVPSVNLDHSDHVSISYSSGEGLKATFSSDESFTYAKESWNVGDGLVLLASAEGCGNSLTPDRCYFLVSGLRIEESTRVIVASGKANHPDSLITSAETEWGWWQGESKKPSGQNQTYTTDFDQQLDYELGYGPLDEDTKRFLDQVMPGDAKEGLGCINNSTLQRRNHGIIASRSLWSWIGDYIVKPVVDAYKTVRDAFTISGSLDGQISWDLPGPEVSQQQSIWGDAILLQSFGDSPDAYMDVFCVGCAASGNANVAGKASWTPLGGFVEGHVELQANVKLAVKLGIDTQIKGKQNIDAELFSIGLPGLSYGLVTIGPMISVGGRVALEAAAAGKLLVGAEMGLDDARAVLDIIDPSKSSSSGWDPYFQPVLEADGELMLAADLALPVSIRCGVQVSQWQVSVGLIDEPSVSAVAQVAGSIGVTTSDIFSAGFKEAGGCAEISAELSWRNKLYVDILGLSTIPLYDTDKRPLLNGLLRQCIIINNGAEPAKTLAQPPLNSISSPPAQSSNTSNAKADEANIAPASNSTDTTDTTSSPKADEANIAPATNSTDVCEGQAPTVYNGNSGFSLTRLLTTSGAAKIVSCSNGNIYAASNNNNTNGDCNEQWSISEDATIGFDSAFRTMHYYTDTMAETGVSRLRLSSPGRTPNSTVAIALVAYQNDQGPDFYVAADRFHQVFYPVVCDYSGGDGSKVFLAKDPVKGLATLQDPSAVDSITGGAIERCYPLALAPF